MRKLKPRRPSPALIVAIIALVAATAGTAEALGGRNGVRADDIARNAVNSSDIRNRTIQTADISSRARRALRGQTGAAGANGDKGDKGDPGTPATSLFGRVNADGSLAFGSPGITSVDSGSFIDVTFPRDMAACSVQLTPFSGGTTRIIRQSNTSGGAVVVVAVEADSGALSTGAFNFAAFC